MGVLGAVQFISISGTNNTSLRVIPSSDNNVIKKCDWLNNMLVIAKIGSKHVIVKAVLFIELRESLSSTYKVAAYALAFNSQIAHLAITSTQSQYFNKLLSVCNILYIFSMKS